MRFTIPPVLLERVRGQRVTAAEDKFRKPAGFLKRFSFLLVMLSATALARPRFDSLSPIEGPIAGGTIVTIRGANLATATFHVADKVADVESRSDTEVRLRMPPH